MTRIGLAAVLIAAVAPVASAQPQPAVATPMPMVEPVPTLPEVMPPPRNLRVAAAANDDGRHIELTWEASDADVGDGETVVYLVFRSGLDREAPPPQVPIQPHIGERYSGWTLLAITEDTGLTDDVAVIPAEHLAAAPTVWRLERGRQPVAPAPPAEVAPPPPPDHPPYLYAVRAALRNRAGLGSASMAVMAGPVSPHTAWFNTDRWFFLVIVLIMAAGLFYYSYRIRRDPDSLFVRRIAGVDAIEDSVGRSTEMGRPVLFVTGSDDIQNIQTIASLLVLGRVAEMIADYDSEIKVANYYPLTMVVAEEVVRQGYANAGRIDAHKPENVMFISAEQFAFAAGTNGIMLRERPATNIMLGRFFAESLMLAETGYVIGAVQIAGTAEITQLPFFIAACDYTLIGEELYAASAYLSREPALLAMLKSTDLGKILIVILVMVGFVLAAFHVFDLGPVLIP